METLALLVGLAIGYYINKNRTNEVREDFNIRINELKEEHRERINEFKESFSKGYQTKNGYEPYQEETKETIVHDTKEVYEETEEVKIQEKERWDD